MRINSVVLAASAVTCLENPSGVSAFAIMDVNDPSLANDYHDAVPARRSLKASDIETGEERSIARPIFQAVENLKTTGISNRAPISFRLRKVRATPILRIDRSRIRDNLAELTKATSLTPRRSIASLLKEFRSKYEDDLLADELVKANGAEDAATKTLAESLLNRLLTSWWREEKSVDDVFESLKLTTAHDRSNIRKVMVLNAYIGYFNRLKQSDHSLVETLTRDFSGEAKRRQS